MLPVSLQVLALWLLVWLVFLWCEISVLRLALLWPVSLQLLVLWLLVWLVSLMLESPVSDKHCCMLHVSLQVLVLWLLAWLVPLMLESPVSVKHCCMLPVSLQVLVLWLLAWLVSLWLDISVSCLLSIAMTCLLPDSCCVVTGANFSFQCLALWLPLSLELSPSNFLPWDCLPTFHVSASCTLQFCPLFRAACTLLQRV